MMSADRKDYNGKVNVNMLYLDPYNPMFAYMMPGSDHIGTDKNGKEVILTPLGMCKVELTDNAGKWLFLKKGVNARAFYPIPKGVAGNLPAAIPLSSFNSRKGIWEEKRMATRVSGTGTRSAAAVGSDISTRDDLAPLVYEDSAPLSGGGDDLAPLVSDDDDLAPLDSEPVVLAPLETNKKTIKGRVLDCDNKPISGAGVYVDVDYVSTDDLAPLDDGTIVPTGYILRTNAAGEWSIRVPKNTDVVKLAAWTNFSRDDDYTEKYTYEGGIYTSRICDAAGYFKINHMEFELTTAAAFTSYGPTRLMFHDNNGLVITVHVSSLSVGNTLPEGQFPIEAWIAGDGSFGCGNDEEHPATLEIKKLVNNRYELRISGVMIYVDFATMTGMEYPCSLYYKTKEYKGPNYSF
jgi:hypothetical protein